MDLFDTDPVLIVGGGIIGLSIGWQLVRNQIPALILEKRRVGREASWTAAGMLAPFSEAGFEDEEKLAIGKEALRVYPSFLRELEEDSGERCELQESGTLFVGLHRSDQEWLQWIYSFKEKQNIPLEWLSEQEIQKCWPLLSPRVCGGIWLPDEKQIEQRSLILALEKAFRSRGGQIRENSEVVEFLCSSQAFAGVKLSSQEEITSKRGVLACGAWSSSFPFPECREIRPVKGQILRAKTEFKLSSMIRTPRVYLAQKNDLSICIGSTSEEKGFDRTSTCGAALQLLECAREVFPALDECTFESLEVNFRPVAKSDLPILKESPISGLHFAMGHGRGGILLAPYTAYRFLHGNYIERSKNDVVAAADFG